MPEPPAQQLGGSRRSSRTSHCRSRPDGGAIRRRPGIGRELYAPGRYGGSRGADAAIEGIGKRCAGGWHGPAHHAAAASNDGEVNPTATQSRSGASAVKSRSTRSGAARARASTGRPLRRLMPLKPARSAAGPQRSLERRWHGVVPREVRWIHGWIEHGHGRGRRPRVGWWRPPAARTCGEYIWLSRTRPGRDEARPRLLPGAPGARPAEPSQLLALGTGQAVM